MIVEYTRYQIEDAKREGFEAAYKNAAVPLGNSEHCRSYELTRCTEDQNFYVLRVVWDSEEGHLKGFRSSVEFKAFFAEVRPFVANIEEMQHYEVLLDSENT